MGNLIFSVKAIIPIFLMIGVGILIRKSKILSKEEISKVNKLVFKLFLPLAMFSNLYGADLDKTVNSRVIVFVLIAIFCAYGLGFLIAFPTEKDRVNRGAMIHAIYRTNFVILGVPIVSQLIGIDHVGLTCLLVAIVVPIYNVLAVITLEAFRGGKPNLKTVLIGIATNPLIIGGVAGLLCLALQIRLPGVIETTISQLASVGTPLAIVILGASFDIGRVKDDGKDLIIVVISRLIILPGIFLTSAYLLGFHGYEFATLMALFAAPTAVSSYTMAQQMGSNENLACNSVIFTTLFSSLSLFLWIFLFKSLGTF